MFLKSSFLNLRKEFLRKGIKRNVILGIESTYDETGAAVIDENGKLLGDSIYSQTKQHRKTVKAFKAQEIHREQLPLVVEDAMRKANVNFEDVSGVATATRPGLYLCLKEGLDFSKMLVTKYNLPFIPVHHMEAHLLTARMTSSNLKFPFLTLLISGGHAILCLALQLGKYVVLGDCLDKPPGAAIDWVARSMLPSQRALEGAHVVRDGKFLEDRAFNADRWKHWMEPPMRNNSNFHKYSCHFSFSGIATKAIEKFNSLPESEHYDVAASFQHTLSLHICRQLSRAIIYCELHQDWFSNKNNKKLVISGGVACNKYISEHLNKTAEYFGWELIKPPGHLCSDNGIMIAWTGYEYWKEGKGISEKPAEEKYYSKFPLGVDWSKEVQKAEIKLPKDLIKSIS